MTIGALSLSSYQQRDRVKQCTGQGVAVQRQGGGRPLLPCGRRQQVDDGLDTLGTCLIDCQLFRWREFASKEGESEAACSLNVTLRTAEQLLGDYKVFYHERLGGRPNLDLGSPYSYPPFFHVLSSFMYFQCQEIHLRHRKFLTSWAVTLSLGKKLNMKSRLSTQTTNTSLKYNFAKETSLQAKHKNLPNHL